MQVKYKFYQLLININYNCFTKKLYYIKIDNSIILLCIHNIKFLFSTQPLVGACYSSEDIGQGYIIYLCTLFSTTTKLPHKQQLCVLIPIREKWSSSGLEFENGLCIWCTDGSKTSKGIGSWRSWTEGQRLQSIRSIFNNFSGGNTPYIYMRPGKPRSVREGRKHLDTYVSKAQLV